MKQNFFVNCIFAVAVTPRLSFFSFLNYFASTFHFVCLDILVFSFLDIRTPCSSLSSHYFVRRCLSRSTLLTRCWQVGLIIVQVFFKERITRSMFTASFSLPSCLLARVAPFSFLPFSLHCGCICWCTQGVKETVTERSELFTNGISFALRKAFFLHPQVFITFASRNGLGCSHPLFDSIRFLTRSQKN